MPQLRPRRSRRPRRDSRGSHRSVFQEAEQLVVPVEEQAAGARVAMGERRAA
jgi:hypothetical protein